MHSLQLTFIYCALTLFSGHPTTLKNDSTSSAIATCTSNPPNASPGSTNIILQSKDGGLTWQDISAGLPKHELPENFFAGKTDLYLRYGNEMYHSAGNLSAPLWKKEMILDKRCTSVAFNSSAVVAYNDKGQIYQRMPTKDTWSPTYTNFKNPAVETIFETSDGAVLLGCRNGLYKSSNSGQSWDQVFSDGWVMDVVESEGVLIGTGQRGIMRSTDNGAHWEWVISEGGVGIAVERINGGFAAIAYNTSTKSRRIHISLDGGKSWKVISEGLRPSQSISSIKQVDKYLICGHPDGIYRSSDMGKTWYSVHPTIGITLDLDTKAVFKIYTSGNMLYAVARNAGC